MERGASRHTAGSRRGQAQKSHLDHFAEQLVDQMIGDSPEKDSGTVEVGSGVAGAVKVVQWDDEEEDDDEEEEAVVTMRRSHGSEKPPIRHAWGSSLEDEESTPVNTKFVSRLQQRHEVSVCAIFCPRTSTRKQLAVWIEEIICVENWLCVSHDVVAAW